MAVRRPGRMLSMAAFYDTERALDQDMREAYFE